MGAKYTKDNLVEAVKNSDSISEVIRNLNGNVRSGALFSWIKNKIIEYSIDTSHFHRRKRNSPTKRNADNILVHSFSNIRVKSSLLKRALLESGVEYKCNFCKNDGYWIDYKISLDIDHIDGNHRNNLISNLRFLCPNCHSQRHEKDRDFVYVNSVKTENKHCKSCNNIFVVTINSKTVFCSKKCMTKYFSDNYACYSLKGTWPDDSELEKMLKDNSICAIARMVGVSDNAVRKHCRVRGIKYK